MKKQDSARYVIIHKYGGVYLDHDVYTFKNLESLLGDNNLVLINDKRDYIKVANGFLATFPGNHLYEYVI